MPTMFLASRTRLPMTMSFSGPVPFIHSLDIFLTMSPSDMPACPSPANSYSARLSFNLAPLQVRGWVANDGGSFVSFLCNGFGQFLAKPFQFPFPDQTFPSFDAGDFSGYGGCCLEHAV